MAELRGLTTVALLKAYYDEGKDYLQMFAPFVAESIAAFKRDAFSIEELQEFVLRHVGFSFPRHTLSSILRRMVKQGHLRKEQGLYMVCVQFQADVGSREKAKVELALDSIGNALLEYSKEQGGSLLDQDQALEALFSFFSDNQIRLLLDQGSEMPSHISSNIDLKTLRLIASFIIEYCEEDGDLADHFEYVLMGFVLQNALLLNDIGSPAKSMKGLEVYLDSGIVLSLAGLKGDYLKRAAVELVKLLHSLDVFVAVFERTVVEARNIIDGYSRRIRGADGYSSLPSRPMSDHIINNALSSSDLKQVSISLVPLLQDVYKVSVLPLPDRIPRYTIDENELAQYLKSKDGEIDEPRVVHDVDCVAAVITRRRGEKSESLEACRAIFATDSSKVIESIGKWHQDCNGAGYSPIIHVFDLSSQAWLRNPAAQATLKLHELVALSAVIMRPTAETWDRFLSHLRRLRADDAISSDEMVAIITSGMTQEVLIEIDYSDDDDVTTVAEAIDRVRGELRKEFEEELRDRELDWERALENERQRNADLTLEAQRTEKSKKDGVREIATVIANVVYWGSLLDIGVVTFLSLAPEIVQTSTVLKLMLGVISLPVAVLSARGLIDGYHLKQLREYAIASIERWLADKFFSHPVRSDPLDSRN